MTHLTDEQIAGWLAGEAAEKTLRHLFECKTCAAEAAALAGGVRRYAAAVRREAQQASLRHAEKFNPRREMGWLRLRWASAAALGLVLAGFTAYVMHPHEAPMANGHVVSAPPQPSARELPPQPRVESPQPAQRHAPVPAMSDDELLEAVNNDLSRDVPWALAPVGHITAERNRIASASTTSAAGKMVREQ